MTNLSPEARQAVRTFWRAAQNRNPRLRQFYLDAVGMVQEEMFNDQLPQTEEPMTTDLMRCNCGHEGPVADFTNGKGKLTKMCGPCREAWGAKRRRKANHPPAPWEKRPLGAPLAVAVQSPAEVAPTQVPEPAAGTITLTLTSRQAERLVELTLRRIIERDPARLTQALPTLVDLLD